MFWTLMLKANATGDEKVVDAIATFLQLFAARYGG